MNNTQRLATIDTLLDGIPKFKCIEGCSDCCGPVAMTALEWRRIIKRTGDTKLKQKMAQAVIDGMAGGSGRCPLLKDNRCSVYDIRPAICRVFGSTTRVSKHSDLRCPHGARPEYPMSAELTDALMDKVQELGGASIETFKLTDFVKKKLNL